MKPLIPVGGKDIGHGQPGFDRRQENRRHASIQSGCLGAAQDHQAAVRTQIVGIGKGKERYRGR